MKIPIPLLPTLADVLFTVESVYGLLKNAPCRLLLMGLIPNF